VSKSQQVGRARRWIEDWGLAVVWALQPVVAGAAFAAALDSRSPLFRTGVGLALWVTWAVVLLGVLIPRTATLTLVRVVTPASVAAAGWAALATPNPDWLDAVALASTAVATVVAFAPSTGQRFVNGSAYGPEKRFPLRAPGAVVLGPVEAVWLVVVVGAATGPLLLLASEWVGGAVAVAIGWPVAILGTRSLHRLAERWLVFVPGGLALVDPLTLTDSVSMTRGAIASIGPAAVDTTATDLTAGSLGLAVEVTFEQPQTIVALPRRNETATDTPVDALLITPTRPGHVLRLARERNLRVS
jgi:hypothetical protein